MISFFFLLMAVVALPAATQGPYSNYTVQVSNEESGAVSGFILIEPVEPEIKQSNITAFHASVLSPKPKSTIEVKHWRIANCDDFNSRQMEAVLMYYPYVEVLCEEQKSILYPEILDETPTGPREQAKPSRFLIKPRSYLFKEVKIESEAEETSLMMPLANCIAFSHEEGPATTEVRLTISAGASISPGMSGGVPVPYFGISTGLGLGLGVSASIYVNHACNRKTAAVRPFISLTTIELRVSTRVWKVSPYRHNFIKKLEWDEEEIMLFSRRAPILSCVSELYEPGVCGWPSEPLKNTQLLN